MWVSYQNGVYDITEFLDKHPGGDQITMSSGKAVEGFWMYSKLHYAPHVLELLEKYRIGTKTKKIGIILRNLLFLV